MKQHPFDGEGLTYEERLKFWDDCAETYSSVQQGDMVDNIVKHLYSKNMISANSSVLELGCGPGTYSLKIAPLVKSMVCVDSSPKMLRRMEYEAELSGITNINTLNSDFFKLDMDSRFNAVISSLCPGTGTPEGLRVMESFSSGFCVHIMWIRNFWDEIHARIWELLGKDYSFDSRKNDVISPYLRDNTRDPTMTEFHTDIEVSMPFEDTLKKEIGVFSAYGQDVITLMKITEDVLSEMREGEIIRCRGRNSIRMISWKPGEEQLCLP